MVEVVEPAVEHTAIDGLLVIRMKQVTESQKGTCQGSFKSYHI